jgi:hypothetical protein
VEPILSVGDTHLIVKVTMSGHCSQAPIAATPAEEWAFFSSFFLNFWHNLLTTGKRPAADLAGASRAAQKDEASAWGGEVPGAWGHILSLQSTQQLLKSRVYPGFAGLNQRKNPCPQDLHTGQSGAGGAIKSLTGNARSNAADILEALHSVFEDLQMNQLMWQHIPALMGLLLHLAGAVGADDWVVRGL